MQKVVDYDNGNDVREYAGFQLNSLCETLVHNFFSLNCTFDMMLMCETEQWQIQEWVQIFTTQINAWILWAFVSAFFPRVYARAFE